MEIQRICEECKNYHLSISESYLLEASGPKVSDLGKIGIKNANGKLTKASKDIAETIKKKGVSSESRKQIHNIISDLFKDLADGIDTSVIKNYPFFSFNFIYDYNGNRFLYLFPFIFPHPSN